MLETCFPRTMWWLDNSNQPTSCCRASVAVTIRGSVLFYSYAIWRPNFHSVKTEFRYLYGVDSIELRTLFYLWKMCCDHHWHWKNTKSKRESRRCQFCWYLTLYFNNKTEGFFQSPGAWMLTIALSSKQLRDPHDVTSQFLKRYVTTW